MSSSAPSPFFLFINLQSEVKSPLTPGSDTSTLFEFDPNSTPSPGAKGKLAALASPTETLADHRFDPEGFPTSPLASRRSDYLSHIEDILSAELNPFDLLARGDPKYTRHNSLVSKPRSTGARCVDAIIGKRLDMQHPSSYAPNPPSVPAPDAQHAAFYDPSSADGYSAPSQSSLLSAAPAFTSNSFTQSSPAGSPAPNGQLGAPNAFRDDAFNPSPISSPYMAALSPTPSHHRVGSHSSVASSPPRFGQGFVSDPALTQALGQIGQISLDEDQRYPPTFDDSSDYVGSPAYQPAGATPSLDASAQQSYPASTSAGQSQPGHTSGSTLQLTLGIPTVSVSDTSMDYTPVAASVDNAMPSINVMAPSPSTPRAIGANGQQGGFQDILAQLARGSNASSSNWLSQDMSSSSMNQEPFSYADASGSIAEAPLGSTSSTGRLVPQGYSAEPTQMMSTLAGGASRGPVVHAQGQWSSQAKRQDSYDKIRQFLRLDVDMGFQSTGKTESPTLASFRKRANSDVGPRSPVVAGNAGDAGGAGGAGSAFDWSFAATSQANAKTENAALDLDWSSFTAASNALNNPSVQASASQMATMDPSLLNNSQLPLDMSQGYSSNEAFLVSLQQQQQQHQHQQQPQQAQHQEQQQIMPPVFQLNGQQNTVPGAGFSSQVAGAGAGEFNAGWRFPGDGLQDDIGSNAQGGAKLRRSSSARSSPGGHRRLAHSEDLSRSRLYQGADEDFLAQITAPNGGLAPPSTGRSVSSSNASTTGHHHTMSSSARVHPYRTGHDRHYSFGSNASSSSTGSASPMPQMTGGLMYDAAGNLVHFPGDTMVPVGMEGIAHSPGASSVASGTSSHSMLAPPVPVVTSQATQAASASRRKSEALFACPIPGCGSTFTRQYNLRGHLRSHADERPYKCDWPGCDKSFARSHDCKRHQNLHLNIKPHTCEQCGKTFARLDALNRHHKSDTGGCMGKSDGESGSTDEGSVAGGLGGGESQGGSEYGGQQQQQQQQQWSQGGQAGSVPSGQPNKAFGGHVL